MKSKSLLAAAIVFLIPALAFAVEKNSANVQLDEAVKVADTQLAPGHYKLTWEGNGPNVTVSFTERGKTVVTAPAKLVSTSNQPEAIETNTATGKTPVLNAVDLKNVTIQFENSTAAAGN